jgi:branched-chain amino acid aminotransferase
MDIPYTQDQICDAIVETVRENGLEECYIRPVVFRGYGEMGVHPVNCPVDVAVAAWEWGAYLGAEALEVGVDAGVSTWRRMAPNTMPNMAKAGGNYLNSQLAKMEAVRHGYDEAIMLDYHGYISEGSGENIFLVSEGEIYTPPVSSSLLRGITRDSVIKIARTEGVAVHEEPITREMLYIADEAFFTGTAAEITPIRSVDGIEIGAGRRGPVTKLLQDEFFRIIRAETEDSFGWLTYI